MLIDKFVEIKIFEPAKTSELGEMRLNSPFSHPARYHFMACRVRLEHDNKVFLTPVGGEGLWEFTNGVIEDFWGKFRAEIVQEISPVQVKEINRFELATLRLPFDYAQCKAQRRHN
ncbi:MAG: hypothetical protein QQW96_03955 [Tychonema bourrellyi B0820]|nr:hypothetical protein [Tychonema bourrellyi B0820]PJE45207.1 MAG: hypothetical protein CUR32_00995 [Flavobacterium sp.] [Flavobacterium sp. FEMGT703F]